MIFWVFYFSAIVYWQISQAINANAFLNLALCLLVFTPIPGKKANTKTNAKIIKIFRSILGYVLGVVLLWHESYLPPFKVIWNFLARPDLRPSTAFIFNFLSSHIGFGILIILLPAIAISILFKYTKLKKYFLIFIAICVLVLFITQKTAVSNNFTDRFFAQEKTKSFKISESSENKFDIVILQICSLSWADLRYADSNAKPFFQKFDYIFTNFNSATPYSDPAALRLLQSECGQKTEGEIFAPVPDKCYLLNNLRALGYSTYSAWNHDGTYSNFNSIVQEFGKADPSISISDLKPVELSFDGSPIYSDKEVLDSWLKEREKNSNKSALFYNSITLHTGSTYINGQKLSEKDEYHLASQNILSDLDSFFNKIKQSNRYTVVILLGEHGAALEGSNIQPATVRDIPLPSITHVPAAIKIFGPGFNEQANNQALILDSPTSYPALIKVLSNLLEKNPANRSQLQSHQVTQNLPQTELVSESESSLVFQDVSGVFYKSKKDKNWNQLPNSFMVGPSDYMLK
jgi:hypothetical protein